MRQGVIIRRTNKIMVFGRDGLCSAGTSKVVLHLVAGFAAEAEIMRFFAEHGAKLAGDLVHSGGFGSSVAKVVFSAFGYQDSDTLRIAVRSLFLRRICFAYLIVFCKRRCFISHHDGAVRFNCFCRERPAHDRETLQIYGIVSGAFDGHISAVKCKRTELGKPRRAVACGRTAESGEPCAIDRRVGDREKPCTFS